MIWENGIETCISYMKWLSLGSNISSFKNFYNIVMVFGLISLQERKYFKIVSPNLSIHQWGKWLNKLQFISTYDTEIEKKKDSLTDMDMEVSSRHSKCKKIKWQKNKLSITLLMKTILNKIKLDISYELLVLQTVSQTVPLPHHYYIPALNLHFNYIIQ